MNTREKLIELLEEAEGLVNNDVPSLEQIAGYLIAHGVTVQEWISVKDRLPELETYTYSVDVLFSDYEEGVHIGYVCL